MKRVDVNSLVIIFSVYAYIKSLVYTLNLGNAICQMLNGARAQLAKMFMSTGNRSEWIV